MSQTAAVVAPGTRHAHSHQQGAALADAARAMLESQAEQWTSLRGTVFEALAGMDRPASAYDVADEVSRVEGRRVAANSVYRILDLFVATNLAQRIESANAYIVNPHPGCRHDCIFLVCDRCGLATHLDNDAVAGEVRAAAMRAGFAASRPVIEVRGLCATCAPADAPAGVAGADIPS